MNVFIFYLYKYLEIVRNYILISSVVFRALEVTICNINFINSNKKYKLRFIRSQNGINSVSIDLVAFFKLKKQNKKHTINHKNMRIINHGRITRSKTNKHNQTKQTKQQLLHQIQNLTQLTYSN